MEGAAESERGLPRRVVELCLDAKGCMVEVDFWVDMGMRRRVGTSGMADLRACIPMASEGKSLRESEAQLRDPKSTGDRWHGAYIRLATDGDATGRNVHV